MIAKRLRGCLLLCLGEAELQLCWSPQDASKKMDVGLNGESPSLLSESSAEVWLKTAEGRLQDIFRKYWTCEVLGLLGSDRAEGKETSAVVS